MSTAPFLGHRSLSPGGLAPLCGAERKVAFYFPNQGSKPLATLFDPYGVAFVIEIFPHLLTA
jgi:hypothetical protein